MIDRAIEIRVVADLERQFRINSLRFHEALFRVADQIIRSTFAQYIERRSSYVRQYLRPVNLGQKRQITQLHLLSYLFKVRAKQPRRDRRVEIKDLVPNRHPEPRGLALLARPKHAKWQILYRKIRSRVVGRFNPAFEIRIVCFVNFVDHKKSFAHEIREKTLKRKAI